MPRNLPKSPYIFVGLVKNSDLQGFITVSDHGTNKSKVDTTVKRLPFRIIVESLYTILESHYGVTKEEIKSERRTGRIAHVRQVFSYWLRAYYGSAIAWSKIADEINKDRTSVIYHTQKFKNKLMVNQLLAMSLNKPGITTQTDYSIVNNKIHILCLWE